MYRFVSASIAVVFLTTSAPARVSTLKSILPRGNEVIIYLPKMGQPDSAERKNEFGITPSTEVLLDGRICNYKDVPSTANVVRIELARDKKSVLKIEFRTK